MRFKLILSRTGKRNFLPFNYQYELSAWIYKIISAADTDFSQFLHGPAYSSGSKNFKLFTFSNLNLQPFKIHKEHKRIEMLGQEATLEISFLIDKAAETFIKGLFINQHCVIGDRISQIEFVVGRIEATPPPFFKETMAYTTLSPLCLSVPGEKHAQYLHPKDPLYGNLLIKNLTQKFQVLPTAATTIPEEPIELSTINFNFKLLSEPKSRLITIKALTAQETKLRGYDFKFELTAPLFLHEIGYYGGFGEKGSLGFGCAGEETIIRS